MTRRSTCAVCGGPIWWQAVPGFFRHQDLTADHPAVAVEEEPDELASVADLAVDDDFEGFLRTRPLDPDEDSLWYGEPLSGWEETL